MITSQIPLVDKLKGPAEPALSNILLLNLLKARRQETTTATNPHNYSSCFNSDDDGSLRQDEEPNHNIHQQQQQQQPHSGMLAEQDDDDNHDSRRHYSLLANYHDHLNLHNSQPIDDNNNFSFLQQRNSEGINSSQTQTAASAPIRDLQDGNGDIDDDEEAALFSSSLFYSQSSIQRCRFRLREKNSIDSGLSTSSDRSVSESDAEDQQQGSKVFEDEDWTPPPSAPASQHDDLLIHDSEQKQPTTTTTQVSTRPESPPPPPPLAQRMDLRIIVLSFVIILNQALSLSSYLVESVPTVVTSLIVALASFGASFGLRKMYVKALLKIFQYATNIKHEKTKECEELLEDDANKSELEKRKELARLIRRRHESFMLHPSNDITGSAVAACLTSNTSDGIDEEGSDDDNDEDLNDIDKQNNNYLAQNDSTEANDVQSTPTRRRSMRVKTKSTSDECEVEGQRVVTEAAGKSPVATPSRVRLDSSKNGSRLRSISEIRKDFQLGDIIDFVHKGIECIIDDDVTKRFTTEELTVWNLLSRTNQQYEYVSFRVTVLWLVGLVLRYGILFPFRLVLFIFACSYTFFSTLLIGFIKDGPFKRWLNWYASLFLHRILSRVFSAIITFHNRENRAKSGSICVANHTSPIDVIILSTDNAYAMIGQTHGGFTGMMQAAFSRAGRHIWFDRSEAKDRGLVAKRMRDHVQDETSMPILIFPEGTCINNTSVMMFKKGCFEVDTTIYPVAIKYDLRFGDAFWNSSQHTMLQYLMLMMTSWAIVVDVYYLPPMEKLPDEDATAFASRVKAEIVKKGSFVDLNWDGMLKRSAPKLDLMYEQQQKYVSQLKID